MKRALGRSSSEAGSDLTRTDTTKSGKSKKAKKEKLPDNIYKPHEMPKPKYRGPYNQAHQDKLSAFSFGGAWKRRKSSATGNSDMSPMGSRIMSRRGSAWSKRSNKLGSRQNSTFAGVEEGEGDDDVGNGTLKYLFMSDLADRHLLVVGLSRQQTADRQRLGHVEDRQNGYSLKTQKTTIDHDTYGLSMQETLTNGRLFTEDELANAMSQSTIKATRNDID